MSSNPPATSPANARAPVATPVGATADETAEAVAEAVAEETASDAAGEAPAKPGDHSFELSLRLLTVVVLLALVGSASLLAYRLVSPRFAETDAGAVPVTAARPKPPPSKDNAGPSKNEEVLMDPRQVFRCEDQGRVSFSDRACTDEHGPARAPAPAPAPGR
jgi:hypothetical protein